MLVSMLPIRRAQLDGEGDHRHGRSTNISLPDNSGSMRWPVHHVDITRNGTMNLPSQAERYHHLSPPDHTGSRKEIARPSHRTSAAAVYLDAKLTRMEYDMAGDVDTMLWSDASCENGVHTWRRLGDHPCPSSGPRRLCVQEHESHAENVDCLKKRNDDDKVKKMTEKEVE
jgi:hypothetical protein